MSGISMSPQWQALRAHRSALGELDLRQEFEKALR